MIHSLINKDLGAGGRISIDTGGSASGLISKARSGLQITAYGQDLGSPGTIYVHDAAGYPFASSPSSFWFVRFSLHRFCVVYLYLYHLFLNYFRSLLIVAGNPVITESPFAFGTPEYTAVVYNSTSSPNYSTYFLTHFSYILLIYCVLVVYISNFGALTFLPVLAFMPDVISHIVQGKL